MHLLSVSQLRCALQEPGYCNAVAMLTRHIIATGGQVSSLVISELITHWSVM